jgi:hypothetical protein
VRYAVWFEKAFPTDFRAGTTSERSFKAPMGILNLGNSEEFEEFEDDSQYYEFSSNDEFDDEGVGSGNGHKRAIGMGFAAAVLFIGAAFGAKVVLNSNTSMEFGQGQQQAVTCQSTALTVTPFAGFINDTSTTPATGRWTLDSVYIEGIQPGCAGVDFTVKVYDNAGNPALVTSDSATSQSSTPYTYTTYDAAKFYMADSNTITSMSNAYTDIEKATDNTSDTTASVQITFDPDLVSHFANAQSVYKISVETSQHYAGEPLN